MTGVERQPRVVVVLIDCLPEKKRSSPTHLIILNSRIAVLVTLVCNLHEEAITQYFPDVDAPLPLVYS